MKSKKESIWAAEAEGLGYGGLKAVHEFYGGGKPLGRTPIRTLQSSI
jgi:hypothetical protein